MNCAIHQIESNTIVHFLLDCVKSGNDYVGSNMKLMGLKPSIWGAYWTPDVKGSKTSIQELTAGTANEVTPLSQIQVAANLALKADLVDGKVPSAQLPEGQSGLTLSAVKADTEIADAISKKHSSGSDNQDLSGLEPKQTGKSLSANDLTAGLKTSYDEAVTHAGSAHAPSGATVGADWNTNVSNKPTIPAAQVQTDWNASAGLGVLLNKPTITGSNTGDQTLAGLGGIAHSLATAASDFLVASGVGAFVKKTLAETLTILGKATASGLASLDASSKLVQAHTVAMGGVGYVLLANDTLAQALATNGVTKLTVTAARTLTTTVPAAGVACAVIILTAGTASFVITFGTGFKPTGTLATGTVASRVFVVNWVSDGTNLYEAGRTVAMVA